MNFQQPFQLHSQLLRCDLYSQKKLHVSLLRSDKIHEHVSGNKWFKLKHALLHAKSKKYQSVISFGGAYSNHIHALAFAAKAMGIPTLGFIRGQWSDDNKTLQDAQNWGMQLESLTREQYREKASAPFLQSLMQKYPNSLIIPEGGSSELALKGVNELMELIEHKEPELDYLVCACGTGGTLAGLIGGAKSTQKVMGIPVLKGAGFLEDDVNSLLDKAGQSAQCEWLLDLDGHYGGYGKVKAAHLSAMQSIESLHDVTLDPVYTAKMWRRFDELVEQDYFAPGRCIALLHSGGLQGRRGFGLI